MSCAFSCSWAADAAVTKRWKLLFALILIHDFFLVAVETTDNLFGPGSRFSSVAKVTRKTCDKIEDPYGFNDIDPLLNSMFCGPL